MDVEAIIGRRLAGRALLISPLAAVVSWALWTAAAGGWAVAGALAAAGSFAATGWGLSLAARRSFVTLGAVAFGGFVIRLALITLLVWAAVAIWDAHLYGMFLGVGAAWLGSLTIEARRQVATG
ncbi:MAG: hypothetical protein OXC98_04770 [bacterium]|nr:hypothetical protein [Acidimicrobiia bacterium]MCY4649663.1 hypothetical protein [bacterium]